MGGVRKGGEARRGRDVGGAARRRGAVGRGRWWRPAAAVLVRQRKKNGEEKEPGERKKKEVDEIAWVHHYPFARGARSPANDSGARSPANDSGARVLKKLVIVFGKGRFTSMTEANSKSETSLCKNS
jgi:hypothetical protein